MEYSKEEIKQYRKKNWNFSAVRALEIQELLEENNVKQAVAVLRESKELDKEYLGLESDYSKQLIQIYEQEWLQNRERLLQRMKRTSNGYRLMEGLFKEMLQSISLEVKKNSWIARLDEMKKEGF